MRKELETYTDQVVNGIREKLTQAGLLPLRVQAQVAEEILEDRLHTLLPGLMEETGYDMWVIASHETNEDPIMWTMVTPDTRYARRCNALFLYRDPESGQMEYLSWMTGYGMDKYFTSVGTSKDQFVDVLTGVCERLDPKKIGINISSDLGGFCGGLSAWLYQEMQTKLPEPYRSRLVSSGRLATRWLETMTEKECAVLQPLSEVTEDLMDAFFSRKLIVPGETTVEDVKWWIKDVLSRCGLTDWFPPHIDYQRKKDPNDTNAPGMWAPQTIIQEGDLLHCDVGAMLKYILVRSDRQWMCYVKREGESQMPEGFARAFADGKRFQSIVAEEFRAGRTGLEIFNSSISRGREAGLEPMLYCHGLGTYGHGAGAIVGLADCQNGDFPRGDLPVGCGSTHALEFNLIARVPEWPEQDVWIFLEEDIHVTDTVRFFGTCKTVIKEI